jgi:hypothetical protein
MPEPSRQHLQQLREQLDRREAELLEEVRAKEDTGAPGKEPHDQVEDPAEQGEERIREAIVLS